MSLEEALAALKAGNITAKSLAFLSGLFPKEEEALRLVWSGLGGEARQKVMSTLVDLAEDNVELDFRGLFRLGLGDKSPKVRAKAIEGIIEWEDTSFITPLLNILTGDVSAEVRETAAWALGVYVLMAEFDKLTPRQAQRVREGLLVALSREGEAEEVRQRALEAVGAHSDQVVAEAIKEAYRRGGKWRTSALYAMGRSGDSSWLSYILPELESPDPERRFEACRACGELEEEAAIPHLITLLKDPDIEVQLSVIDSLGHLGGKEAEAALEALKRDPSPAVREAVAEALENICLYKDPFHFELS